MEAERAAGEGNKPPSELSDAELLAAYRGGGDAAFAELVRRHQIAVFRLLLGMTSDADNAERLCEQVFFDAARRIEELSDAAQLQKWLLGIARGHVKKAEEKQGKQAKPAPPKRSALRPRDPQALVKQEVKGALQELTSDERVALLLADLEGDSFESIGQTLGVTSGEAEDIVNTARVKFEDGMHHAEREVGVSDEERPDVLPPGTLLGDRFCIEVPLGRGGMGAVYRAKDLKSGQPVAIKTLLPASEKDPALRRRFAREAEIIQRVEHPNFVRFVEHGERPGEPSYVAMELVHGATLNDVLEEEHRLSPKRALHIVQHMLAGLGHAHAQGVIHRDVKPENVMLVQEAADPDFAKLLDLGIAKLTTSDNVRKSRITQKGELIGTPLYICPELLRGEDIDGRADLYSLTVVLYEMLASRPPFESRNTMGLFAMHLATEPPLLSEAAPDLAVPPALERLLREGLAKEPNKRIASAQRYAERIEEVLRSDWQDLSVPPQRVAMPAPEGTKRASDTKRAEPVTVRDVNPTRLRTLTRGVARLVRSRQLALLILLGVVALAGLLYWVARALVGLAS